MPSWTKFWHRKEAILPQVKDAVVPNENLFSTEGEYGLKTMWDPEGAIVDIVFVHGLTGNRDTTWTYNDSVLWPRDLLPKDIPHARILTFGYDADVARFFSITSSNTIRDHGKSFAQDLAMFRARTKTGDRPIIFVAHSLGGLVVEQAILIARGSSQAHVKSLLDATVAIAFMGTPHLGSKKAEWGKQIARFASLFRRVNRKIVAVLEPDSEMLANLQQEFHTLLEDRRKNQWKEVNIYCFYESIDVATIGKIVPDQSAILPQYPNQSIQADHSGMTKFKSRTDPGYVQVSGILWLWVQEIENSRQSTASQRQSLHESQQDRTNNIQRDEIAQRNKIGAASPAESHRSSNFTFSSGNISVGRNFSIHHGAQ
ncbi:hypothetical protein BS50DRAFT_677808 [Corynespora cassiicola Philippines]|uniref:DUF676 domain-containing protein n=1 Tax=Corynespora cassiicola Philippines TaxID=1448308 RepID=A0A2T2NHK2_CORCC|nr:hypothetical protein BS50DRAFT_677808 [Corynespora cassiicola Philippines]